MSRPFPAPLNVMLLGLMALIPLPLAATRPLAEAALGLYAALLMLVWNLYLDRSATRIFTVRNLAVPLALCGTLALWLLLQALPMPAFANPVWAQAEVLLGMPTTTATISLDPGATQVALMRLLAFMAIFGVTVQAAAQPAFARKMLYTIAFSSAAYAAYGLLVYLTGNATILSMPKWAYFDSLTGTHVSRNSFAAFCGMGLLATAKLLLRHLRNEMPDGRLHLGEVLRHMGLAQWGLVAAAPILAAALLLTNSRGGVITSAVGMGVLMAGVYALRIIPRKLTLLLVLLAAVAGGIGYASLGHNLDKRMTTEVLEREDRPLIWHTAQQMIADRPFVGQGAGAFETAFYNYRDESLGRHFARAHSAYLEWAAEMGLPATILWLGALGWVALQLVRGLRTRQQGVLYPLLAIAVLVQAALHSIFDFAFQINANAVIFTMLMAMGVAQSRNSGLTTAENRAAPEREDSHGAGG